MKKTDRDLSSQKNSEIIGISPNYVQKIFRRNAKRGFLEIREEPERKRSVNERADRVLSRGRENRRQTLSDLNIKFNESIPQKVSNRNIRRRLKYLWYSVTKKTTILKPNCKHRVSKCRLKLGLNIGELVSGHIKR